MMPIHLLSAAFLIGSLRVNNERQAWFFLINQSKNSNILWGVGAWEVWEGGGGGGRDQRYMYQMKF